jgi:DNA invertase Pin-like site-specific DNA recombinase
MACVLASVSCYEGEVRRERQQAGIAAAKAAGRTWGGSPKGRRLTVTDQQASLVKRLRREGLRISEISRSVNLTRPTIYKLLSE